MTQSRCRAAWDSGMARRPLCADNVPQIEHFEILRPVCAQYTCITTRKTRVCLYTISLLQHTRIRAIYKQGTHTYAMSLVQNEEPRQASQASVFSQHPPVYVAPSGGLPPYVQQVQLQPQYTVQPTAINSELFANSKPPPMQPQNQPLCMQPQPLCIQPQPLCMQQVQMLPAAPNCFVLQ